MYQSRIQEPELIRPSWKIFSRHYLRPNRVAWEWAFPSVNLSLRITAVGFGLSQAPSEVPSFSLNCRSHILKRRTSNLSSQHPLESQQPHCGFESRSRRLL